MYFLLGKDVVILTNNEGFSVIEALVSLGILVTITTTFLPLSSLVSYEKEALSQKRKIVLLLHDELQSTLSEDTYPIVQDIELENVTGTFRFFSLDSDSRIIKACASWTSIRNRNEEICMYGKKE
jgi:Tfp pilus assembly protein PilV